VVLFVFASVFFLFFLGGGEEGRKLSGLVIFLTDNLSRIPELRNSKKIL